MLQRLKDEAMLTFARPEDNEALRLNENKTWSKM